MERHEYLAFQTAFKTAVLNGENEPVLKNSLQETKGVPVEQRLQIHFNNFRETLSDSLSGIYPALTAFVGEAFVKGALKEYCASYPPEQASLAGYGESFSKFLSTHKASEQLPYIADIVRLEWALHALQQVDEVNYDNNQGVITLSMNVRLIKSDYPLMSLWSVAVGQLPPEAVHLEQGGQTVCVLLNGGEISLLTLDKPEANLVEEIITRGAIDEIELGANQAKELDLLMKKKILVRSALS